MLRYGIWVRNENPLFRQGINDSFVILQINKRNFIYTVISYCKAYDNRALCIPIYFE